MEKIYRAAKYIRTSCSDDESQYRDSVANQRKLIDAFIQAHPEIIVVSEKIDEGYSGLFTERPAFQELLADIESGVVNCFIIKDLSRLSRDYIETGRYLRDYFPAYRVRFISVDDNIDSIRFDGFDKIIAFLKSIFSEQYSRDVSLKTRTALDVRRRQGKYVSAIPMYGYQKSVEDRHQLIPDPNTADIVQSIFQMKLNGMSVAAISSVLNKSGTPSPLSYKREHNIPHPTGGFADKNYPLWSATTVLRILRDANYTGTLVQGRQSRLNYKMKTLLHLDESEWVKTDNAHPAIISHADYETVQRILAIDTRTPSKRNGVYLFSGILICGCCNGNMTRKSVWYKEQRYIYYYCPTGKNNGCLSASTVSEKELLSIVKHKVRERISNIERLRACFSDSQLEESLRNERIQQVSACIMKICDLHRYRLYLFNSKAEGHIGDVEYRELQDFYDTEIARIEAESSFVLTGLRCTDASVEKNLAWIQSFSQFSHIEELDRYAVVKMIHSIRILAKKEIMVNFVHQFEYERLVRYTAIVGGRINGKKEPQRE